MAGSLQSRGYANRLFAVHFSPYVARGAKKNVVSAKLGFRPGRDLGAAAAKKRLGDMREPPPGQAELERRRLDARQARSEVLAEEKRRATGSGGDQENNSDSSPAASGGEDRVKRHWALIGALAAGRRTWE